ncbi:hypothetical protein BH23ACT2_BH23ACT2_14640 [soil metagenome]
MTTLVLASGSPRRGELLGRFGVAFEVRPVDLDESPLADEEPEDLVRRLAVAKAEAALATSGDSDVVVLAADTVVVVDGAVLGKPADRTEAATMLRRLSGRTHQVVTGVATASRRSHPGGRPTQAHRPPGSSDGSRDDRGSGEVVSGEVASGEMASGEMASGGRDGDPAVGPAVTVAVAIAATAVTFVELTEADIAWYVATGEPFDKAGAYGIQGRGALFVASIRGSWDNVVGLPLVPTRRLLADAGLDPFGPVASGPDRRAAP